MFRHFIVRVLIIAIACIGVFVDIYFGGRSVLLIKDIAAGEIVGNVLVFLLGAMLTVLVCLKLLGVLDYAKSIPLWRSNSFGQMWQFELIILGAWVLAVSMGFLLIVYSINEIMVTPVFVIYGFATGLGSIFGLLIGNPAKLKPA